MRIALVTEIPAPFRIPLFNALADRAELQVLFLARTDPRRAHYDLHQQEWRFDHRFLRGRQVRSGGRWTVLNRGVLGKLRAFRPDAVGVGGWNQPAFWQALVHCKAARVPLLIWIESTTRDARSEAVPLELAKRALVRGAAGAFVPGRASAEYARALGVPEERIVVAPNAVDNAFFAANARKPQDGCRFLYVGRLDPEKGLDLLLEAFERVPGELVIAGDGSEAEALRGRAGAGVRFLGPVARDDLPALYGSADVFVLPSRSEQWGMVLNEAAASGLTLVATDAAGAAYELVDDDLRVPAGDVAALANAMRGLAGDSALRAESAERSRERVASLTPERWAEGVLALARRAGTRRSTRAPSPGSQPK
jgi:glycosyltransferase involved in cell wall biosynthesis